MLPARLSREWSGRDCGFEPAVTQDAKSTIHPAPAKLCLRLSKIRPLPPLPASQRVGCSEMNIRWLGRIPYEEALALQEEIVARKIASPETPDELLLLEHEPVYTIGRTPDQSSLRSLEDLPHAVIRTNRGGQATYHGPGQLVGYPMLDLQPLGRDLHRYLRALEEALINTLREFGVTSARSEGQTGVWVGPRKIASIGVGVRKWISMHGFALNVSGDLAPFTHITPCGIAGVEMTSLTHESGCAAEVRAVGERLAEHLQAQLASLRNAAGEREERQNEKTAPSGLVDPVRNQPGIGE